MNKITLDFETYYDSEYGLGLKGDKFIPLDIYIRDKRFKIHGVAVKVNDEPTVFLHKNFQNLKRLPWHNSIGIMHNAYFDAYILNYCFGIIPKKIHCTMGMSRALWPHDRASLKDLAIRLNLQSKLSDDFLPKGKRNLTKIELDRLKERAVTDVDITSEAYCLMELPELELDLIDLTIRLYTEPILRIDHQLLESRLKEILIEKEELCNQLHFIFDLLPQYKPRGSIFSPPDYMGSIIEILSSNDKLELLYRQLGVNPPTKISPATGLETNAFAKTDASFRELLKHKDKRVRQTTKTRLSVSSNLEETRIETFLKYKNIPISVHLNYYKAHTGRWSGGDGKNLQNLPQKSILRNCLLAQPDHVLVVCDSSQIEARTLAWYANQEDLLQIFRDNGDPYSDFATDVFGFKVDKSKKGERFVGKTCILGLGYGMGGPKLQTTLKNGVARWKIPTEGWNHILKSKKESYKLVSLYRNKYPKIVELWYLLEDCLHYIHEGTRKEFDKFAVDENGIELPNGLYIRYPDLSLDDDGWFYVGKDESTGRLQQINLYGGKICENLIQAAARIVVAEQGLEIHKRGYKIVLLVHDEVVVHEHKSKADSAMNEMLEIMYTAPTWGDIPVAAEGGYDVRYSK